MTTETRGYASISTPEGKYRMWISRPTKSGRMTCNCGFALANKMPFVDGIESLGYVSVEEVRQIDSDFSYLILRCVDTSSECMLCLIEDIPALMEKYLTNA